MDELSIITINLNNAKGLEKTIRSVVGQTFTNFEYVVIDGNSMDGSVDIIRKYSVKISRWLSEPDKGIYNAMNKGIRLARGKYCLFLNSGDYLYSESTLSDVFRSELKEDIVYGDMIIEKPSGEKETGKMPDEITLEHMVRDTLWHPVSFIKRELFEKFGYYREDLKITGDYEFFFKNIIVNKVSTRHASVPIAVFALDGMSSNPTNINLILSEREGIQLKYGNRNDVDSIKAKIKSQQEELTRKSSLTKRIKQWFQS